MNKKKGDLLTRGVPEVCDEPAEDDRKRDEVQPVGAVVLFQVYIVRTESKL